MKILHLYSDYRWTGPAEPALQMGLAAQDLGHDVTIAYVRSPEDAPAGEKNVGMMVEKYGLKGTDELKLDRYFRLGNTLHDLRCLPGFVRRGNFDIVHTHLSHDHSFGALLIKLFGGRERPTIIRSLHKRTVLETDFFSRFLLRKLSDGLLCFTDGFRQQYIEDFNLDPECIGKTPMPIDLERFRPGLDLPDIRGKYNIPPDAPLIGIVGRFQKYRRMDVFLEGASELIKRIPNAHFLVIGRSSQIQQTVVEPIERLGLKKNVILAGYLSDEYLGTIGKLDVFSLLMPGFDGTARAVREAMALGIPCVTSDFGMLPDIVPHNIAGKNVPLDPMALADAWEEVFSDRERLAEMGRAARKFAEDNFRIDQVGPVLIDFYEKIIARRS